MKSSAFVSIDLDWISCWVSLCRSFLSCVENNTLYIEQHLLNKNAISSNFHTIRPMLCVRCIDDKRFFFSVSRMKECYLWMRVSKLIKISANHFHRCVMAFSYVSIFAMFFWDCSLLHRRRSIWSERKFAKQNSFHDIYNTP